MAAVRTPRSHCEEESGDDRRPVPLDMGHHKGAEEAGAGHHRDRRRVDVEAGNPPSEAVGECGVHSHLHSILCGRELGTVHGSDPGDCIHGAQGTFARSHPWEGKADEGNGTCRDRGRDVLRGSGSGRTSDLDPPVSGVVWALTSAMHVTVEPLNSRWSSFSTAVFRSLAVSNSTNLGFHVNEIESQGPGRAQDAAVTHPFPCSRPVSE